MLFYLNVGFNRHEPVCQFLSVGCVWVNFPYKIQTNQSKTCLSLSLSLSLSHTCMYTHTHTHTPHALFSQCRGKQAWACLPVPFCRVCLSYFSTHIQRKNKSLSLTYTHTCMSATHTHTQTHHALSPQCRGQQAWACRPVPCCRVRQCCWGPGTAESTRRNPQMCPLCPSPSGLVPHIWTDIWTSPSRLAASSQVLHNQTWDCNVMKYSELRPLLHPSSKSMCVNVCECKCVCVCVLCVCVCVCACMCAHVCTCVSTHASVCVCGGSFTVWNPLKPCPMHRTTVT